MAVSGVRELQVGTLVVGMMDRRGCTSFCLFSNYRFDVFYFERKVVSIQISMGVVNCCCLDVATMAEMREELYEKLIICYKLHKREEEENGYR
jgi:hypothetical protein